MDTKSKYENTRRHDNYKQATGDEYMSYVYLKAKLRIKTKLKSTTCMLNKPTNQRWKEAYINIAQNKGNKRAKNLLSSEKLGF